MSQVSPDLGQRVDQLRQARGWSVSELARRVVAAGAPTIRHQHISSLIRTRGRRVSWLPALASAFGISVEELCDFEGALPVASLSSADPPHMVSIRAWRGMHNALSISALWATAHLPDPANSVRALEADAAVVGGGVDRGDLVLIDTRITAWNGPGVYVLAVAEQCMLRALYRHADGVLVAGPAMPGGADEPLSANALQGIAGRVVGVLKALR